MTDGELGPLLAAAQAGEQQALDQFVLLTQDRVFRYALGQLQDPDLAADATQETFTRMLSRLNRWRARIDPLAWVLAFTRNVVREFRRRRWRDRRFHRAPEPPVPPVPPVPPDTAGPPELLIRAERMAQIRLALDRLPPRQREVVGLRILQQLSVETTAQAMGCRPGTVKALLHKAILNLKKMVAERGSEAPGPGPRTIQPIPRPDSTS